VSVKCGEWSGSGVKGKGSQAGGGEIRGIERMKRGRRNCWEKNSGL
jgi:hypothetical protein